MTRHSTPAARRPATVPPRRRAAASAAMFAAAALAAAALLGGPAGADDSDPDAPSGPDALDLTLTASTDGHGDRAEVAVAAASPADADDEPVAFTAACAQTGGCGPATDLVAVWDFGDGATATTNHPTADHAYVAPGRYRATVTVTTESGVGRADMDVLVAPRLADTAGRDDRAALDAVAARRLLEPCRPAVFDGDVADTSDLDRALLCVEPEPVDTHLTIPGDDAEETNAVPVDDGWYEAATSDDLAAALDDPRGLAGDGAPLRIRITGDLDDVAATHTGDTPLTLAGADPDDPPRLTVGDAPTLTVTDDAAVTLRDLAVAGCRVDGDGGAVRSHSTDALSFDRVDVADCHATGDGGAVAHDGDVSLTSSVFADNHAGGDGGALAVGGALAASDTTLDGNTAGGGGGAAAASDSLALTATVLSDNAAGGDGGAVRSGGSLSLTDVTADGNTAGGDGGAVRSGAATSIADSDFADNHAGGDGGAAASHATLTTATSGYHGNTSPALHVDRGQLHDGGGNHGPDPLAATAAPAAAAASATAATAPAPTATAASRLPLGVADTAVLASAGDPYDPTRCDDGWTAVRRGGEWEIAEGTPPGCATRGDLYAAAVAAVDATPASRPDRDRAATDGHVCDDAGRLAGAEGFALRRSDALGLLELRDGLCAPHAHATADDAYGLLARVADAPDAPAPDWLDDADDVGDDAAALLALGAPLVADHTCPDEGDDNGDNGDNGEGEGDDAVCFNPDQPLTRAELARLLAALRPDGTVDGDLRLSVERTDDGDDPGVVVVVAEVAAPPWFDDGDDIQVAFADDTGGLSTVSGGCDATVTAGDLDDDGVADTSCTMHLDGDPGDHYPLALVTVTAEIPGHPAATTTVHLPVVVGS